MEMEKVKVIFRKAKNPYTKEYEVIAFFPEASANFGNILSYMQVGQHAEATHDFYMTTKKATKEEYQVLYNELKGIYNEYELVVKRKIYYKDLLKAWKQ